MTDARKLGVVIMRLERGKKKKKSLEIVVCLLDVGEGMKTFLIQLPSKSKKEEEEEMPVESLFHLLPICLAWIHKQVLCIDMK